MPNEKNQTWGQRFWKDMLSFSTILSVALFLIGLNVINDVEKKFFPVDIDRQFLAQNIDAYNMFDSSHEEVKQKLDDISNHHRFYSTVDKFKAKLMEYNEKGNFNESDKMKLFIVPPNQNDFLHPKLEKNSGKIRKTLLVTKNNINDKEDESFTILNIDSDKRVLIIDLEKGNHQNYKQSDIVLDERRSNKVFQKETDYVNVEKSNIIAIMTDQSPKINLIHMLYEDYSGNKSLVSYLVYECNCLEKEGVTRTDVNGILLIAIGTTDSNDLHFMEEIYNAIKYRYKANLVFKAESLGNHLVKTTQAIPKEQSNSLFWKEDELKTFESFQRKILSERKKVLNYLEGIGE